jgi:hypothetical protein
MWTIHNFVFNYEIIFALIALGVLVLFMLYAAIYK